MAGDAKSKRDSKKGPGRGGPRPGAGRPPERKGPGRVSWTVVRKYARIGADRDLIVQAMGLQDQVRDPDVLARLQEEVARGAALHRIDLLEDVHRVRKGGNGKVSAVLASLKQHLDWLKPDSRGAGDDRPEAGTAVAEIQRMLGRFRAPG